MQTWIIAFVIAAVVFGVADALWIGKLGRQFYTTHLGHLLAPEVNRGAAVAFYVIYLIGITHFATYPALREGGVWCAALNGALLGLVAYATWNLTNWAVLRDYPAAIVPIDMAWGILGTALTSVVVVAVMQALNWS